MSDRSVDGPTPPRSAGRELEGGEAELVFGLDAVERAPSVVAIGFFDGVHRGHQMIVQRARVAAAQRNVRCVAVTFDRHPMEVVRPGSQPPLLQALPRRAETLRHTGVDVVVIIPFDDDLRHRSPEAFVEKVLAGVLEARHVVVGENFRFGHRAAGDVALLAELGDERGFSSEGVPLLSEGGRTISSTAIREALTAGDVAAARGMLGRPHAVDGIVVRGDGRGHELGFPTANLQVDPRIAIPAPGVYAGWFTHPDGRRLAAASSVGTNPTFGGEELRVEAYLLDVDEDLYGLEVSLDFCARVRGEVAYGDADALVAQMHDDVREVRRLLDA